MFNGWGAQTVVTCYATAGSSMLGSYIAWLQKRLDGSGIQQRLRGAQGDTGLALLVPLSRSSPRFS